MPREAIHAAIDGRRLFIFDYAGKRRRVRPVAFGRTTTGADCVRAFEVLESQVASDEKAFPKLFDVSKLENWELGSDGFDVPDGYRPGDNAFVEIYVQL